MTDEPDHDASAESEPVDDRESMEQIVAEMAELLRRMAEFQKEMEPFLPLLLEAEELPAEEPPADESDRDS